MKRILKSLVIAAVLLLAPTGVSCEQADDSQDEDAKYATELLKPGTMAPDFSLKTPEGKTVKLSDCRGSYVVLDFWGSWCPDCIKDVPNINRMYATYKERGIVFIGVALDDDKAKWTAALSKYGIEYTQVSELKKWKSTEIAKDYAVKWIPTLYLLDPEGRVVLGTVMSEKIEKELGKISPVCE